MRPRVLLVAGASLAVVAVAAPAYAGPGAVGPGGGVVGGPYWIPDPGGPVPVPEPPYFQPPQNGPTQTPAPAPEPQPGGEPSAPTRPDPRALLDGAEWQVDRVPDDAGGELLCVTAILPNETLRSYGCVRAPRVVEPSPEPKPAG